MAIAPTAGPAPVAGESAASTQPWPNEGRGWFALAAVIFATFTHSLAVTGCVSTPVADNCDDSKSCTTDSCDPANGDAAGCVFTQLSKS